MGSISAGCTFSTSSLVLLGSVAEAVVHRAPCLVLTVPGRLAPAEAASGEGRASERHPDPQYHPLYLRGIARIGREPPSAGVELSREHVPHYVRVRAELGV